MIKEDKENWEKEYNDIILGYKNTKDNIMVDYYERKWFELRGSIGFINWLLENDEHLILIEIERKEFVKALRRCYRLSY